MALFRLRRCSTIDCPNVLTPRENREEWQVFDDAGLVCCPEHQVCPACLGEGYTVFGDREYPCWECAPTEEPEWEG